MNFWAGQVIGRPGSSSWSLPNATSEPANEIEPTIAENMIETAILASSDSTPASAATWYSEAAISAAAPPPTPLNSATICGIAVIFTRCAATTPMTVPTAMPMMIQVNDTTRLVAQRGDDGDQHADRGHDVAAPRRAGRGQELQAEDEQDRRRQVGEPDGIVSRHQSRITYVPAALSIQPCFRLSKPTQIRPMNMAMAETMTIR